MLDSVMIHDRKFEIKEFSDKIIGKVINNTTSSGKLRSTKRGARLAFELILQDVTETDRDYLIESIYPLDGFIMIVNDHEEYYVTIVNEEITFGDRNVDIHGNVFYDNVSLDLEEVLPEMGAVIL